MNENESLIITETSLQKSRVLTVNIIRMGGVIVLIAGILALSDMGGIASGILKDNLTRLTIGGSMSFVGLIDILILPLILKKGWEKAPAAKRGN